MGRAGHAVQVGRRSGKVAAQVAGPQVVGGGQPPDIGADRFPGGRPRPDRQRGQPAVVVARAGHGREGPRELAACEAMSTWSVSMAFLVICSVPSMTAWIAALRTSQSRLPIIPPVRW